MVFTCRRVLLGFNGILDGFARPVSGGEAFIFVFFLLCWFLFFHGLGYVGVLSLVGLSCCRFGKICILEPAIQFLLEHFLSKSLITLLVIRMPSQTTCVVLRLGVYRAVAAVMTFLKSTLSDLAPSLSLVRLLTMLKRRLLVKFVPVGVGRVLQGLAREQAGRSKFVLLLAVPLIIATNHASIIRQPME